MSLSGIIEAPINSVEKLTYGSYYSQAGSKWSTFSFHLPPDSSKKGTPTNRRVSVAREAADRDQEVIYPDMDEAVVYPDEYSED